MHCLNSIGLRCAPTTSFVHHDAQGGHISVRDGGRPRHCKFFCGSHGQKASFLCMSLVHQQKAKNVGGDPYFSQTYAPLVRHVAQCRSLVHNVVLYQQIGARHRSHIPRCTDTQMGLILLHPPLIQEVKLCITTVCVTNIYLANICFAL